MKARGLGINIAAILTLLLGSLFFPFSAFAQNYGDGLYGSGLYGIGDVPNLPGPPICHDTPPGPISPVIYAVTGKDATSITVFFNSGSDPYDHYALEYGTASNNYPYGIASFGNRQTRSVTVNSLKRNTRYFFRVRAGNGCATGPWSNEMSGFPTRGGSLSNSLNVVSSTLEDITPVVPNVSLIPDQTQTTQLPTSTTSGTLQPTSEANFSLHVKIKDDKGAPISGAKITLHSTVQEKVTNKDGLAFFNGVEAGDHTVDIAYNNQVAQQNLTIGGDPLHTYELTVTLQIQNPFLNKLVIVVIGSLIILVIILGMALILKRNKASSLT